MKYYEEVITILHDQYEWILESKGKKLVADTMKAITIAEKNQSFDIQKNNVNNIFSDSAIRKAKKIYDKYLSICVGQLMKEPDKNMKNLAKELAFIEIQEYRFKRWFSNSVYWFEVENALCKLFPKE